MKKNTREIRFICDRMAGSLCRYLRLMGYDTLSANDMPPGDPKEDTKLLMIAQNEDRIILTRDAELSGRDQNHTIYLEGEHIDDQIRQLLASNLIVPLLRLNRCSLCNCLLIPISDEDLADLRIKIPGSDLSQEQILWCPRCMRAYWDGSHTADLRNRLNRMVQGNIE